MSFSADVKTECCEVHGKYLHCLRAELAGLVLLSGTISLGSGGLCLLLNTESRGVVTRIFSLVKRVYGLECELLSKTGPLKKNEVYSCLLYTSLHSLPPAFIMKASMNKDIWMEGTYGL